MTQPESLRTMNEILDAARDKETQARDFYGTLVLQCPFESVRGLLERLKDEETRHLHLIEALRTRLNLGRDPV